MRLRSETIMSNMLRSPSSDDKIRGQEGENSLNPRIVEPFNVLIAGISHSPKGSSSMNNNNSGAWPPYGLPPGYAPLITTQSLTSPLYSIDQNSPYQNVCANTIMANLPILGSQTLPYGILPTPPNLIVWGMSGLVFLLHHTHQIQLELKMQGLFSQTC